MPSFGDAVLVPFPFTDQSGTKTRPAVVVSSPEFHSKRRDVVIMAISSQVRPRLSFAEAPVREWKVAGLLKPSLVKPVVATIDQRLIHRTIGRLATEDLKGLRSALLRMLG